MTPKQQAFCDYYIASGNATEAAIKAGYSTKTARSVGSENLTKPDIKNYIAEHMQKAQKSRIATAEEILEYLSSVVRNTEEQTRERTKAAELLGKRYALFEEVKRNNDTTPAEIIIQPEDASEAEDNAGTND